MAMHFLAMATQSFRVPWRLNPRSKEWGVSPFHLHGSCCMLHAAAALPLLLLAADCAFMSNCAFAGPFSSFIMLSLLICRLPPCFHVRWLPIFQLP
jgi:hypothetical protein